MLTVQYNSPLSCQSSFVWAPDLCCLRIMLVWASSYSSPEECVYKLPLSVFLRVGLLDCGAFECPASQENAHCFWSGCTVSHSPTPQQGPEGSVDPRSTQHLILSNFSILNGEMGEGGISCALGVRSLIISEVEHPCLCLLAIRVFQSTSELLFMETLHRKGKASYTPRRVICHTQSRQRLSVKYICKKRTTHLIENRRNSWHFTETAPPTPSHYC